MLSICLDVLQARGDDDMLQARGDYAGICVCPLELFS